MREHPNVTWREIEKRKWNRFTMTLPLLLVPIAAAGMACGVWLVHEDHLDPWFLTSLFFFACLALGTAHWSLETIRVSWRDWRQYHDDVRADPPSLEARLRIREALKSHLLDH